MTNSCFRSEISASLTVELAGGFFLCWVCEVFGKVGVGNPCEEDCTVGTGQGDERRGELVAAVGLVLHIEVSGRKVTDKVDAVSLLLKVLVIDGFANELGVTREAVEEVLEDDRADSGLLVEVVLYAQTWELRQGFCFELWKDLAQVLHIIGLALLRKLQ